MSVLTVPFNLDPHFLARVQKGEAKGGVQSGTGRSTDGSDTEASLKAHELASLLKVEEAWQKALGPDPDPVRGNSNVSLSDKVRSSHKPTLVGPGGPYQRRITA